MNDSRSHVDKEQLLLEIHEVVHTHLRESRVYYKEGLETVDAIEEMAQAVKMMAGTYLQLEQLPNVFADIAAGIKSLHEMGIEVRNQLIAPATGVDRMDTKAVYMIMGFSLFVVLLLGSVIIVDRITGKNIEVSAQTPMGSVKVQGGTETKVEGK